MLRLPWKNRWNPFTYAEWTGVFGILYKSDGHPTMMWTGYNPFTFVLLMIDYHRLASRHGGYMVGWSRIHPYTVARNVMSQCYAYNTDGASLDFRKWFRWGGKRC